MASASSEFVEPGVERETVADLREQLARSERRRRAAEEWGEFLEVELEARDAEIETKEAEIEAKEAEIKAKERRRNDIIQQYERRLEAAETEEPGFFERLFGRFR